MKLLKKKHFENINGYSQLRQEIVVKKARPVFDDKIEECYKKLIEKCWCSDPSERLTFDEIINILKTDPDFIANDVEIMGNLSENGIGKVTDFWNYHNRY